MMHLVHDFLEHSAAKYPEKTALICDGRRLTYAEIDRQANQLAHALIAGGVRRGDRVLLHLPNCMELVISIYGALKANAVFVPVNPSVKQDKLTFLAQDSQAAGLITRARNKKMGTAVQKAVPSLHTLILAENLTSQIASYPLHPPHRQVIDQDLACLIYTSGSTGDPKGVMSAHSNVVFAASSIITYLQNQPDDIIINVLPLSFDYGLYQLIMAFQFGGTLVLERSFAYPSQILRRMVEEKVTGFPGVPTLFAVLMNMDLSNYDLSHVRYITNTAAALPTSHIQEIQQKFPGIMLFSMYGLTETKRTLYLPPEELARRPASVGIPIPGTEAWLEDDSGQKVGPGKIGELVIRGRHVMRGYWNNPEASAHRYRPGPLPGEQVCLSGDLFRMDEKGFFFFVGRQDDIIKSRGEKVAPKEVENVLYALPNVMETAVIGVPDPMLGEAIKAFVVSNGQELSQREIIRHCRAHLEDFMVPQIIEFRDSLPKTDSGKIKKSGLR